MDLRLRGVIGAAVAVSLLAAATGAGAQAAAPPFHPGSADLGDPLTPGLGNGGYDVGHYDIALTYQPTTGLLTGTTTVTATATENLSRFDLDFALPTRSVTVNDEPAAFSSRRGPSGGYGRELVVTPQQGLRAGSPLVVVVSYRAKPADVLVNGSTNWYSTPTGVSVWNEPDPAAEWWYPGNDHPSDKATYDVRVTTPKDVTAITNGRLLSRTVHDDQATAHWRSTDPMATYLTELTIGRYDVTRGTVLDSIPSYTAYESGGGILETRARHDVSQTPRVLAFLQRTWGPYPLAAAGGVVVGMPYPSSLETQTRPVYEYGLWQNAVDNLWVVVHENAHQWFGDSVTAAQWRHIWLAEGFATYSEWLWSQAQGTGTSEQLFLSTYQQRSVDADFWSTPLDDPYYPLIISVYQRGAMLLQALRNRIGGTDFQRLMRTWLREHRHGTATTADFEALATQVSGQDLTSFFSAWVRATEAPEPTVENGFPASARTLLAVGRIPTPASAHAIARADAALARSAPSSASGAPDPRKR